MSINGVSPLPCAYMELTAKNRYVVFFFAESFASAHGKFILFAVR